MESRCSLPFSEIETDEEEDDEEGNPQGHEGARVEGQPSRGRLVLGPLQERGRLDSTHLQALLPYPRGPGLLHGARRREPADEQRESPRVPRSDPAVVVAETVVCLPTPPPDAAQAELSGYGSEVGGGLGEGMWGGCARAMAQAASASSPLATWRP